MKLTCGEGKGVEEWGSDHKAPVIKYNGELCNQYGIDFISNFVQKNYLIERHLADRYLTRNINNRRASYGRKCILPGR